MIGCIPGLSPSFWRESAIIGILWLIDASFEFLPRSSHGIFPVSLSLPGYWLIGTLVIFFKRHTLLHYDLILTNYNFSDPIYEQGHVLRYWGLGLQHTFLQEVKWSHNVVLLKCIYSLELKAQIFLGNQIRLEFVLFPQSIWYCFSMIFNYFFSHHQRSTRSCKPKQIF